MGHGTLALVDDDIANEPGVSEPDEADAPAEDAAFEEGLLALGPELVLHGRARLDMAAMYFEWSGQFVKGDETSLRAACASQWDSERDGYVLSTSLGRGFLLAGTPRLGLRSDLGATMIECPIKPVRSRRPLDTRCVAMDRETGDLCFVNGDVRWLDGRAAAVQSFETSLGAILGEVSKAPEVGTRVGQLFHEERQTTTKERLMALEFLRLSFVTNRLPYVSRLVKLELADTEVDRYGRVSIKVEVDVVGGDRWVESIRVYVGGLRPPRRMTSEESPSSGQV